MTRVPVDSPVAAGIRDLQELLIRDWLAPSDLKTRVVDHYTTAAGLLGILSSGSLRGTNAAFLDGAGFGERKSVVAAAARLPLARYGYDEASVTTTDIPFIG